MVCSQDHATITVQRFLAYSYMAAWDHSTLAIQLYDHREHLIVRFKKLASIHSRQAPVTGRRENICHGHCCWLIVNCFVTKLPVIDTTPVTTDRRPLIWQGHYIQTHVVKLSMTLKILSPTTMIAHYWRFFITLLIIIIVDIYSLYTPEGRLKALKHPVFPARYALWD